MEHQQRSLPLEPTPLQQPTRVEAPQQRSLSKSAWLRHRRLPTRQVHSP